MKRISIFFLIVSMLFVSGCTAREKNLYLPEVQNDKTYATVGGEKAKPVDNNVYQGDGYTISIPSEGYRFERDYDDGNLEEKWDYLKGDDIEIKVTTYKNTNETDARRKFLRDNDDYIIEDLTGSPILGTELDGDSMWFAVYEANGDTYIVSWEYPRNTSEELKVELANIASTFKFS